MGKNLLATIKKGMNDKKDKSAATYWDHAQHSNSTHNNGCENGP